MTVTKHADELVLDIQIREETTLAAVADYAAAMEAGATFPPVKAVRGEDGELHVVDGHHRVMAAQKLQREIEVEVIEDETLSPIELAVKYNVTNGIRLRREEKMAALAGILRDNPQRSNNALAKLFCVTQPTIGTWRKTLEKEGKIPRSETVVGEDGREIKRKEPEPETTRKNLHVEATEDENEVESSETDPEETVQESAIYKNSYVEKTEQESATEPEDLIECNRCGYLAVKSMLDAPDSTWCEDDECRFFCCDFCKENYWKEEAQVDPEFVVVLNTDMTARTIFNTIVQRFSSSICRGLKKLFQNMEEPL